MSGEYQKPESLVVEMLTYNLLFCIWKFPDPWSNIFVPKENCQMPLKCCTPQRVGLKQNSGKTLVSSYWGVGNFSPPPPFVFYNIFVMIQSRVQMFCICSEHIIYILNAWNHKFSGFSLNRHDLTCWIKIIIFKLKFRNYSMANNIKSGHFQL